MTESECEIRPDGSKYWYVKGGSHYGWNIHNEGGPAIEQANGVKHWYKYGHRHREDGPAVEFRDGTCQWYFNSKWLNPVEAIDNRYLKENYRTLIGSMLAYLVHNS